MPVRTSKRRTSGRNDPVKWWKKLGLKKTEIYEGFRRCVVSLVDEQTGSRQASMKLNTEQIQDFTTDFVDSDKCLYYIDQIRPKISGRYSVDELQRFMIPVVKQWIRNMNELPSELNAESSVTGPSETVANPRNILRLSLRAPQASTLESREGATQQEPEDKGHTNHSDSSSLSDLSENDDESTSESRERFESERDHPASSGPPVDTRRKTARIRYRLMSPFLPDDDQTSAPFTPYSVHTGLSDDPSSQVTTAKRARGEDTNRTKSVDDSHRSKRVRQTSGTVLHQAESSTFNGHVQPPTHEAVSNTGTVTEPGETACQRPPFLEPTEHSFTAEPVPGPNTAAYVRGLNQTCDVSPSTTRIPVLDWRGGYVPPTAIALDAAAIVSERKGTTRYKDTGVQIQPYAAPSSSPAVAADILKYIERCKNQSLRKAQNGKLSKEEGKRYRDHSKLFGLLWMDVTSRIDEAEEAKTMGKDPARTSEVDRDTDDSDCDDLPVMSSYVLDASKSARREV